MTAGITRCTQLIDPYLRAASVRSWRESGPAQHRAGGVHEAPQRRESQRVAERSLLEPGQALDPRGLRLLDARSSSIITTPRNFARGRLVAAVPAQ